MCAFAIYLYVRVCVCEREIEKERESVCVLLSFKFIREGEIKSERGGRERIY